MAPLDRDLKSLRLTSEQNRRLEKEANKQGLTQQAFMINVLMRGIEDSEAQREQAKEKSLRGDRSYRRDEPIGLGLFRDKPKDPPRADAPQQSQVVVNVGNQDGAANDIVTRLADDVTNGPEYNRNDRLQTALSNIRQLARGDTEREEMTQRLNELVSARTKAKPGGSFWNELKELIR